MHAAMMGDMSRSTSPADHARFDGKRPVADAPGHGYGLPQTRQGEGMGAVVICNRRRSALVVVPLVTKDRNIGCVGRRYGLRSANRMPHLSEIVLPKGSGANARNTGMCVEYGALPSGSEDRVPDFGRSSALSSGTPHTKLSLTDAMHKVNAGDRDRRIAKLLEPLHRSDTLLDTAMVLLNQVIEILRRPQLGLRRQ